MAGLGAAILDPVLKLARWLTLVPAVATPVLVAAARMYRGMHHPTDVLGSVVLAALWVSAAYLTIRPNADLAGQRTGVDG